VELLTRLFPLWAIVLSSVAYAFPGIFTPLAPAIPPLLGVVMLGMGLTLTTASFTLVARRPFVVLVGVGMQYLIMPLVAWLLGMALGLPAQLVAGLVLVGSCPGGTASNVITYLARGAVALSITLTAVSTVLSVVATPFLTWLLVGRSVPVPVWSMLQNILTIVLLPVAAGVAINMRWGKALDRVRLGFPAASVTAIVVIIAIIVALNREQIASVGPTVMLAVSLHNLLGLTLAFAVARALRFSQAECRTLAIEVGMQNSGLGVVLAHRYFSALAALPGAIFSIWHNLTGSLLAAYWSRRPT
jgi:BASS family bile acid:Na+ symporter